MSAWLSIENLNAAYGDIAVLHNISLDVNQDEIVCLIGSNGAGKTTLLRCLSGLLAPSKGQIRVDGKIIDKHDTSTLVEAGIAHVPEGRRLFSGLSVFDNLMLGAYRRTDGHQNILHSIEHIYELFPRLAERRNQEATTLSGGEQQMCAIARGLMAAPKLLMIDELSLGLAPKVVDELVDALRRINAEGTSLLIVEQDVTTALDLASRGYVMDQGEISITASSEQLYNDPAVRTAYLGI